MQTRIRTRALALLLVVLAATGVLCAAHAADNLKTGGPYVPTPQVVVDQMLRVARVAASDFVVDLGSGDGVIVLSAARQYQARGMGVEIDGDLIQLSNASAQSLGIADRVRFVQQDIFKTNLSDATVVTLYLLPSMMLDLRSKIFNELKPGTRVVSHDYHFGDWPSDDSITFAVPEKEKINGSPKATIYLWYVPAKIAGKWEIKVPGGPTYELTLKQRYQNLEGSVTVGGQSVRPQYLTLRGSDFSFALPHPKGVVRFTGAVKGEAMAGTVESPDSKAPERWTGVRTVVTPVAPD